MPSAALKSCAAALAGLACLAAASAVPAQTPSHDVAQVCQNVVGLAPGEKHFAACVQSLSDSVGNLERGRDVAAARRECLAQGLQPDTGAFAECELNAARTETAVSDGPGNASPRPGGARDYFMISREAAYHRDELACARLGFDPDQGAFSGCVSDLKAALARASEPAM
jgi:hypothetical protein